jgi:hypothetical protein
MLMSTIANVNRGKAQRPYRADEFLPKWQAVRAAQGQGEAAGAEQMLRTVRRLHKAMGGG